MIECLGALKSFKCLMFALIFPYVPFNLPLNFPYNFPYLSPNFSDSPLIFLIFPFIKGAGIGLDSIMATASNK